ncbi:MAG TPA: hypothetical protein VGY56_13685 [Verrucomicrobiae bacterium]|nr:hypothetical protein [Verrucomicrobiae bacterium]
MTPEAHKHLSSIDPVMRLLIREHGQCGLSPETRRTPFQSLVQAALSGVVPGPREIVNLSDDEIILRLTQVRGVGRWTVEMLLIFQLGRHDVLPAHDFGVRNGFRHAYRKRALPEPKQILAHGEIWRPFRTTASWYLWCAADALKKKK